MTTKHVQIHYVQLDFVFVCSAMRRRGRHNCTIVSAASRFVYKYVALIKCLYWKVNDPDWKLNYIYVNKIIHSPSRFLSALVVKYNLSFFLHNCFARHLKVFTNKWLQSVNNVHLASQSLTSLPTHHMIVAPPNLDNQTVSKSSRTLVEYIYNIQLFLMYNNNIIILNNLYSKQQNVNQPFLYCAPRAGTQCNN